MPGSFAELLAAKRKNNTWKSSINNTPRGVMLFALKSCTNSLPTPDTLNVGISMSWKNLLRSSQQLNMSLNCSFIIRFKLTILQYDNLL